MKIMVSTCSLEASACLYGVRIKSC